MAPRKQANTTPKSESPKTREKKQYAEVNLADLNPVKVTKQEKATVLPGRDRTEAQQAVDKTVREIVEANIANGLPKLFRDMEVVKYTLPTEQAETVRFMIGKACTYLNCKAKFGKPAADNGLEIVSFSAIPRDPAQWTDKVPASDEKTAENGSEKTAESGTEKTAETTSPARTDPSEFAEQ